jgi:hypothetical protein
MKILSSFKQGLTLTRRTKRMIFFAWFVNVVLAMAIALPTMKQLDGYLRGSVADEQILERTDPTWVGTYRADMEKSEYVRGVDWSIYQYAPFLNHLEMQMNGAFIKTLADFVYGFFIRWELNLGPTSLLFFLSLLYVCTNTFLAGGFIGIYAKQYPSTFTEFLMDGARYFGKFFRLALVALILYYLFYSLLVDWINSGIQSWTQNDASEAVPYRYYMIRNVVVLFMVSLLSMIFDYARVRMVVDERTSSLGASYAGARFAFANFANTYGLYLLLIVIGFVLIVLYAVVENMIPQHSYWPLVLLFIVQQLYMLFRLWLKANFYASQTRLYQSLSAEQHALSVSAAQPSTQV